MCVDHRRAHAARGPEELLHGADVVAALQQVRGKGVAEGVRAGFLGEAGAAHRLNVLPNLFSWLCFPAVPYPLLKGAAENGRLTLRRGLGIGEAVVRRAALVYAAFVFFYSFFYSYFLVRTRIWRRTLLLRRGAVWACSPVFSPDAVFDVARGRGLCSALCLKRAKARSALSER